MCDLVHENIKILTNSITLDILRLDRLHPVISGNKWFKLKGYLPKTGHPAGTAPPSTLVTFGGAWSNHIVAAAFAAKEAGIPAVGFIRGECPSTLSATLHEAASYGMQLTFISRSDYSRKEDPAFLDSITRRFPGALIIPEGGAGKDGIRGCEEILRITDTTKYTHILCAIGTGAMFLGLVSASAPGQMVLGIPILKGIENLASVRREGIPAEEKTAWCSIVPGYHFGGYARQTPALLDFMNQFYRETGTPSDFVYTGKLFFAAMDLLKKSYFPPHSRLLLIHSGGLQGNRSLPKGTLDF